MDMSLDTTLKIGLDTYKLMPGCHCDECAFYAQEVRLCPATQNRERLCETIPHRVWKKIPIPFDDSIAIPSDDIARVICMKVNMGTCHDSKHCQDCREPCRKEINRQVRRLCGEPVTE